MTDFYEHKLDPVGVRPDWLADDDAIWPRNSYGRYPEGNHDVASSNWAWSHIDAIRIPADHWAVPALKQGFTPWPGGDKAPADWDGGEVLLQPSLTREAETYTSANERAWLPEGRTGPYRRVIGYRKTPESKLSEGVTPELVVWVHRAGRHLCECAKVENIRPRTPDAQHRYDEMKQLAAEYEAATKPPVDPVRNAVDEALKEWLQTERVEPDFMELCAKRGLTITKADVS